MTKPNDANDAKVGYKSPPKRSRFKKGKSGNPKGRPKKKRLDPTLEHVNLQMTHMMLCDFTFTENGEAKTLPYIMWLIKKLQVDALKGERAAQKMLLDWFRGNLEGRHAEKLGLIQAMIDTGYSVNLEKGTEFLQSHY